MPTSRIYAATQGARAGFLALLAGYVDSYALLSYSVYASFMSGNTTQAGLLAGQEKLTDALHDLLPIPIFVIGIFGGTLVMQSTAVRRVRWFYAFVALLLVIPIAVITLGQLPDWLGVITLSLAMGVMNTTIQKVGGQSIGLGYVTGSLNNLAQNLAFAFQRRPVANAEGPWDTHGRRAALLTALWLAFLSGALLGGAATPRFAQWALLAPVIGLLVLASTHQEPATDPEVERNTFKDRRLFH